MDDEEEKDAHTAAMRMRSLPRSLRDYLIVKAGDKVYDARHWHRDWPQEPEVA